MSFLEHLLKYSLSHLKAPCLSLKAVNIGSSPIDAGCDLPLAIGLAVVGIDKVTFAIW